MTWRSSKSAVLLRWQSCQASNPPLRRLAGRKAYYFIIGYTILLAGICVAFYKTPKPLGEEHEAARKRIRADVGQTGVGGVDVQRTYEEKV
ncbi:hypothetical protein IAR50_005721 [Cryptococcus sp. DSM 104548]